VLVDSALADIPSEEVCRRLKADPRTGEVPIVVVDSYLSRPEGWQRLDENSGDGSRSPATRKQVLDRIHALLAGGQFHLFSGATENANDGSVCDKGLTPASSMQFDG
jgi:CheY-like chemotaxis protein